MPVRARKHNPFPRQGRRIEKRASSTDRGYDGRWRKARAEHLKNEPLCRPCAETWRVTAAQEVDHIIPHKGSMALFWDRENWQSICRDCHERKSALEAQGASVTPRSLVSPVKPLVVVCGPPAAGKTTYVRTHAHEGDLVIDLDDMAEKSGKPLHELNTAQRMNLIRRRNEVLSAFCEGRTNHPRCWLIATAGTFRQRKFWKELGAEVVVLHPGAVVCKQRIREDTRPTSVAQSRMAAVDRWH